MEEFTGLMKRPSLVNTYVSLAVSVWDRQAVPMKLIKVATHGKNCQSLDEGRKDLHMKLVVEEILAPCCVFKLCSAIH